MRLPDTNGPRFEDLLQQDAAFRSHDRAEPASQVVSPEAEFDPSDPWAGGLEPWPAPRYINIANTRGDLLRAQARLSDTTDQIFGVE